MSTAYLLKQSVSLAVALGERDAYTAIHSGRVEALSAELGARCGLSSAEIFTLRTAAKLHDVGKIGIPDRILLKQSSFEPAEWKIMQTHSIIGQRICEMINHKDAKQVAHLVRHHHENFDGSGYPDQLAGEDIPISSRIIAIVDSYDAMSTVRPYHQPRSHMQVMEIINSEVGRKIDPYILSHFEVIITHNSHRAD